MITGSLLLNLLPLKIQTLGKNAQVGEDQQGQEGFMAVLVFTYVCLACFQYMKATY